MRKELYAGVVLDKNKKLELLLQAKKLIEENGIDDYVVEMRQPHCMGGEELVVTSIEELDKDYIGYRGFIDYKNLLEKIK